MNLGLCIANLLRQYPEVGVPGIGVFKITRAPAPFDKEQSAFLPPVRQVELAEGKTGGFPITDYLQAQRQVDEETAIGMLDNAVQELFDAISRNGKALLEGLGYLVADGASIVFKPIESHGFGWKSIKEQHRPSTEKSTVGLAEYEKVEDEKTNEGSGKRQTTKWVVAAVLLVLLSATGLAWYYKQAWFDQAGITQFFGQTRKRDAKPAGDEPPKQTTAAKMAVDDSIAIDSTHVVGATDSATAERISDVPAPKPVKPSVTYEIIVGSFATMQQAKKYVAEMKAKGYNLHAINSRMPGNRKKISWGSFTTEREAYQELVRVQKNFEPGAWIAKIEHD
ncbi:SPOR domain-containing protein [Parapedobacter tibetensis]|uniref:SPOR domain-containing protein n=1 Tax=Parapedobacter tibetensis TaxID=2972951 RepID=UPI00214DB1B7|nr:SPOR domain-containing protein [Parapedobacter tibetensis]